MDSIIIYNLSIKKQARLLFLFECKNDSIRKLVLNYNLIKELFEHFKNESHNKEETCINQLNQLKL
jgi:hypothetical protein